MRLYVLQMEGTQRVEQVLADVFTEMHTCWVKGNDWHDARHRALQHATANGVDTIGILVGSCELYHRPHWNGNGPESKHARAHPYNVNGMWLYMQRLARRYAHVYVPPLAAMRPWASVRKYPVSPECNPVPACCAVYRVDAVRQAVRKPCGPWGADLCASGNDSFTVFDFFHHNLGERDVLDETGTQKQWKKAYEYAIHRHL